MSADREAPELDESGFFKGLGGVVAAPATTSLNLPKELYCSKCRGPLKTGGGESSTVDSGMCSVCLTSSR